MSTTAPASSQRPGFVAISTATGRSMDYTDFAFRTLHPPDVLIQIEEDLDNEDDPHYHPTYIDLATSIYDKAVAIDSMFDQQNVHFSAQDDDWESYWRKRVGTPLTRFRDQWLSLREIPPSGVQSHGSDPLAAGRRTGSLKKDLTRLGKTYFNSHPGPDNLASNIALHGDLNSVFNKYIEKREHTDDELMVLFNKVIWRLNLMADADEYILAMGLKFAKCSEYILPINRHMHSDKDKLQKRAYRLLIESKLINRCPPPLIPQFTKPLNFLSCALAENCKDEIEIDKLIAKAVEWKKIKRLSYCLVFKRTRL